MKICYALRRGVYYPSTKNEFGEMPDRPHRAAYLKKVKAIGFDGFEIPAWSDLGRDDSAARELGAELRDAGAPVLCVRGGGPVGHPREGARSRERLHHTIQFAAAIGATVVNSGIVSPSTHPGGPGAQRTGEPVSQGASRYASEADFVETAKHLRDAGKRCADLGLDLSIEIHQGSIADNSWSGLHLTELIDLPNVGVNPDLGNVYWQFDEPEETSEEAILAMAPKAKYWHCKNLKRVYFPQLQKAIYLRVPLDQGDIDYRFAITAMHDAGYKGYLAVEGSREGDQLTHDAQSHDYARRILAELEG